MASIDQPAGEPLTANTILLEGGPAHGHTRVLALRVATLVLPALIGGQYRSLRYVNSGRRTEWGAQIWVFAADPLPGKSEPPGGGSSCASDE